MIRVFRKIALTLMVGIAAGFTACAERVSSPQSDIAVTIQPLKYIIESITGDDFSIETIVPNGASPETYEPTPKQIISLSNSKMIFSTGLIDFENSLLGRFREQSKIVNLSQGIELIEGSCSHNHSKSAQSAHNHSHGVDPHIWTSPRELKVMAENAYNAIAKHYPDSTKYHAAYQALITELEELDKECEELCRNADTKAFVVYHPALTYFARAYGIEQITVESDGKEPSAKHLATIIEQAKQKGVKCVLYQRQYPRSVVEVVAKDMGIEAIEFDPLAENVTENILHITHTITGNKK
jgi:zinc transport system substrate-binding protein